MNILTPTEISGCLTGGPTAVARAIEAAVILKLAGVSVEPSYKAKPYSSLPTVVVSAQVDYYSRDQLNTAIAAARVRENERIADWYYNNKHRLSVFEVPDAIRALLRK